MENFGLKGGLPSTLSIVTVAKKFGHEEISETFLTDDYDNLGMFSGNPKKKKGHA